MKFAQNQDYSSRKTKKNRVPHLVCHQLPCGGERKGDKYTEYI